MIISKKKTNYKKLFIVVVISSIIINYQNTKLDITNFNISHSKVNSAKELKILHLSDLHCKNFGKDQSNLLSKIEDLSPDIVFFTGDLMDGRTSKRNYKYSYKIMEELVKDYPVYYVTGNHEYYSDNADEIKSSLIDIGVSVLNDESTTISINDTTLNIYGLDDGNFNNVFAEDKLTKMTKDMDKDNLNILLSHRPELFDVYSKFAFDFIFSGHAHGGQFRIPFTHQGIIAPGQGLFPKLTEGTHILNNSTLIVSRGLGNSLFPFRLFNQPEIVTLVLEKK